MKSINKFERTIFISAYRNVSARYILDSDIFKTLVNNKKHRIIIFVKKENVDYYKNLYSNKNVKFVDVQFEELFKKLRSLFGSIFNIYRMLTSPKGDFARNETADIFLTQYQSEWASRNRKTAFLFYIIKLLSNVGSNSNVFRSLMIYFESLFSNVHTYNNIFIKYNPSLLVVSSVGHMIDVYIMNAAKKNGVKILTIFHNWDGPTTKGYKTSKIDYAVSWNTIMKNEIINYQEIPPENIFIGGAVNYEKYFKMKYENDVGQSGKKLDRNSKKIIYAIGATSLWPNNFDPLYQILRNNNNGYYPMKFDLILRIHPNFISNNEGKTTLKNNINKVIKELKDSYPNNFSISIPRVKYFYSDYQLLNDDLIDLGKLLNSADIVITQYSTILLEAAIFDLPAICIGYGSYRNNLKPANFYEKATHIKAIMKYDSFFTAYDPIELDKYIKVFLNDSNKKSLNRLDLTNEMFPIRENVGKNIAHYIEKVAKGI